MDIIKGIKYNFLGLSYGLQNRKLLFWGILRFFVVILIGLVFTIIIFSSYQETISLIWARPESKWLVILWHIASWIMALFLMGISAIFSYLISQLLFSVVIMDIMSRITELNITHEIKEPQKVNIWNLFIYLIKQEIPRTIIPILISVLLIILGLVVPLGSILAFISTCLAIIFLAWDNTDVIPARRLEPFKSRFAYLIKTIPFHLGFGLPFLIPVLNILFLSFAPVGATLYYLDKESGKI
ncbi:MAG: EI24 domain-containing protein [Deltaproteobacteria bacterium]|nr:EI24 domain-containing protein [Deltaproteobacteria bacterium]